MHTIPNHLKTRLNYTSTLSTHLSDFIIHYREAHITFGDCWLICGCSGAGAVGGSYGTASTYPAAGLPGTDGALRVAAAGVASPVAAYGAYGAGYSSAGGYPHAGYANGGGLSLAAPGSYGT